MNKVTSNPIGLNEAKDILKKAYDADPSSSYIGDFRVNGNSVSAQIQKQETPGVAVSRFTVTVSSSVLSTLTLTDIVE